jgi:hypothetical protein
VEEEGAAASAQVNTGRIHPFPYCREEELSYLVGDGAAGASGRQATRGRCHAAAVQTPRVRVSASTSPDGGAGPAGTPRREGGRGPVPRGGGG